jgi:hypothetical protein
VTSRQRASSVAAAGGLPSGASSLRRCCCAVAAASSACSACGAAGERTARLGASSYGTAPIGGAGLLLGVAAEARVVCQGCREEEEEWNGKAVSLSRLVSCGGQGAPLPRCRLLVLRRLAAPAGGAASCPSSTATRQPSQASCWESGRLHGSSRAKRCAPVVAAKGWRLRRGLEAQACQCRSLHRSSRSCHLPRLVQTPPPSQPRPPLPLQEHRRRRPAAAQMALLLLLMSSLCRPPAALTPLRCVLGVKSGLQGLGGQ